MTSFLDAIARMEGFYVKGSRPQRNHNPGDIEYGKFARAHGANGTDGRFAIFPDDTTGFAAMSALFKSAYLGLTITQAINKYAPSDENNTTRYINLICQWTGLTPDTILNEDILNVEV
jgi:hypothetical protein